MSGHLDLAEQRSRNPRWPLPPRCSCGAAPHQRRSCPLAVAAGRDASIEECPTWQAEACEAGWLADVRDAP